MVGTVVVVFIVVVAVVAIVVEAPPQLASWGSTDPLTVWQLTRAEL